MRGKRNALHAQKSGGLGQKRAAMTGGGKDTISMARAVNRSARLGNG